MVGSIARVMLAFACVFIMADATGIDYNDCTWVWQGGWETVHCPAGFVGTGACGSGSNADCNTGSGSKWAGIYCCQVTDETATVTAASAYCTDKGGSHGVQLECPSSQPVVYATCGSGKNPDCGNDIYTRVLCCVAPGLDVDMGSCHWSYGNFGAKLYCGSGEVLNGRCGSGSDRNCPQSSAHGISCCDV